MEFLLMGQLYWHVEVHRILLQQKLRKNRYWTEKKKYGIGVLKETAIWSAGVVGMHDILAPNMIFEEKKNVSTIIMRASHNNG